MSDRRRVRLFAGVVAAFAAFWGYVFLIAPSAREDKLRDPAFARAAQPICQRTINDLDANHLRNQVTQTPAEQASLVAQQDAYVTTMVQALRALPTGSADDAKAVSAWLQDWDQWLRDRASWVAKLQTGERALFEEKARDNGEPWSKSVTAFAATNGMAACAPPVGI